MNSKSGKTGSSPTNKSEFGKVIEKLRKDYGIEFKVYAAAISERILDRKKRERYEDLLRKYESSDTKPRSNRAELVEEIIQYFESLQRPNSDSIGLTDVERARLFMALCCPIVCFSGDNQVPNDGIIEPLKIKSIVYSSIRGGFRSMFLKYINYLKMKNHSVEQIKSRLKLTSYEWQNINGSLVDSAAGKKLISERRVVQIITDALSEFPYPFTDQSGKALSPKEVFLTAGCVVFEVLADTATKIYSEKSKAIDNSTINPTRPKEISAIQFDSLLYKSIGNIRNALVELEEHLDNILNRDGFIAMTPEWNQHPHPQWPITYEYFMEGALFFFGQFFASIQMLMQDLGIDRFSVEQNYPLLFSKIEHVVRAIDGFPPDFLQPYEYCEGNDAQVFLLHQRALGELMIVSENNTKRCMRLTEFYETLRDQRFKIALAPLIGLLQGISPEEECRWKRLDATLDRVIQLRGVCEELLASAIIPNPTK